MARPRTYWNGHLRLSLVSIEVELYAATERKAALSLHQIHKPTGKRVRYEKVVPGHGPVDNEEIVKGFEWDDSHVILEPDELDEIKLESRNAIRLVQFVGYGDIDPRFFERPYYVTPRSEDSAEGFVVIREALRKAGKVGLGQMAMRGREYLVAVSPCGRGLLLETLRYAEEVRDTESVFDGIPDLDVDRELLDLADELIERKTAPFDPTAFKDSYRDALRELIERKRQKRAVVTETDRKETRRGAEVVDLMEALKKSVSSEKSGARGKSSGGGKRAGGGSAKSKSAGKRESRSGESKSSSRRSQSKKAS